MPLSFTLQPIWLEGAILGLSGFISPLTSTICTCSKLASVHLNHTTDSRYWHYIASKSGRMVDRFGLTWYPRRAESATKRPPWISYWYQTDAAAGPRLRPLTEQPYETVRHTDALAPRRSPPRNDMICGEEPSPLTSCHMLLSATKMQKC